MWALFLTTTACLTGFFIFILPVATTRTTAFRFKDTPITRKRHDVYVYLGYVYMLLIGTQWMSMPIRSAAFQRHVSAQEEAWAKSYSTVVMVPVVLLYNIFTTVLKKPEKLVSIVCNCYAVFFLFMSFYLGYLDVHEEGHLMVDNNAHKSDAHAHSMSTKEGGAGADTGGGNSEGTRRFLMYMLYAVIETKASVTMAMIWSCVHLFFRNPAKAGAPAPNPAGDNKVAPCESGNSRDQNLIGNVTSPRNADHHQQVQLTGPPPPPANPGAKAEKVYPFLNFWCQVGAAVGSALGILSKSLQLPFHSGGGTGGGHESHSQDFHDGSTSSSQHSSEHHPDTVHADAAHNMEHTSIVTGTTILFFLVAFGTGAIPYFAGKAFAILEEFDEYGEDVVVDPISGRTEFVPARKSVDSPGGFGGGELIIEFNYRWSFVITIRLAISSFYKLTHLGSVLHMYTGICRHSIHYSL
jgi:hypothetical protein